MRSWLVVIALAGCGDNLQDPNAEVSGSRLRLVRYVFDDGTRVADTRSFYDASRGERCGPRRWSDGATYCTPAGDDVSYSDDGCKTAIGRITGAASAPSYFFRSLQFAGVSSVSRAFPSGAMTSSPSQYWLLQGSLCNGPFPSDGNSFFTVGGELDSSAFVRIRRLESGTQGRLGVLRYATDDGLNLPVTFHDRALAADCDVSGQFGRDSVRCAPANATHADYFHDASCSEPAISVANDTNPAFISQFTDATGCTSYFDVGDEVTMQPLYATTGPTCSDVSPPPAQRQYVAGTPIDTTAIARARVPRAGARLLRTALLSPPLQVLDALLFDTATGAECLPTATNGTIRCLPETHATIIPLYTDDQCQQPVEAGLVPIGTCDPVSTVARLADEVRTIGDPYPASLYEISTGDRCVPYTPPPRTALYMLPTAVPVDSFALATITTD